MSALFGWTWIVWPSLTREGRTVDALAVDGDVAVDDELARLGDRAGEAGTEDEGVETHLEELDEVLTGQTFEALGLLVGLEHLGLADAVLGAKTRFSLRRTE